MFKKKSPKHKGLPIWAMTFILVITAYILTAMDTPQEKKYPASFTQAEWVQHSKWIDIAKTALLKSDLPSRDVAMISDSLTAFQNELGKQLVPLFQAENKSEKPPPSTKPDSSSKKN